MRRGCGVRGDFYSGERFEDELTPYVELVRRFIVEHGIDTAVDLGCGDFQVGARIADAAADYVGVDVVSSLIERNRSRFGRPGIRFEHLT
jgi:predicted TPR repeat methyltransferase